MKNINNFNIVPLLNYKFKYIGFFLFVVIISLFFFSYLFNFIVLSSDLFLIFLNLSLIMINFSLEKKNLNVQAFRLYHSFKFSFVFLNTFLISIFSVSELFKLKINLNILTILLFINFLFLLHYYILKFFNIEGEIKEEVGVKDNYYRSTKLYHYSIILSILTLFLIIFIGSFIK